MEIIKFENTWCDYLTPCPYKPDIMVGDWECSECSHHVSMKITKDPISPSPILDMSKYFKVAEGEVECNYKDNHGTIL